MQSLTTKSRKLERELVERQNALDEVSLRQARQQRNLPTDEAETIRLKSALRDCQSQLEEVKEELVERERSLRSANSKIGSLESERERVTRELKVFEKDLETQRGECQRFGSELQRVKINQDKASREHAAELAKAQRGVEIYRKNLARITEELDEAQKDLSEMKSWRSSHTCDS